MKTPTTGAFNSIVAAQDSLILPVTGQAALQNSLGTNHLTSIRRLGDQGHEKFMRIEREYLSMSAKRLETDDCSGTMALICRQALGTFLGIIDWRLLCHLSVARSCKHCLVEAWR